MIEERLYRQFSNNKKRIIKGITIHNTGNSLSAKENVEFMAQSCLHFSTHVFIDEKEVIEVLPLSIGSYHTGKANDKGNNETIAIEICRSTSSLDIYLQAQKKAIIWIKEKLNENQLDYTTIYFHNDFDERAYCPHRILSIYNNKKNFIKKEILYDT